MTVLCCLLVLGGTSAGTARAQGERSVHEAVRVVGSSSCMHHSAIVARLVRWLGTDRLDERLALTLDVGELSFRIDRPDGTAQRRLGPLPGPCADRLDAVTLAMALAIDHTLLERLETEAPGAAEPAPPPRPLDEETDAEGEAGSAGDGPRLAETAGSAGDDPRLAEAAGPDADRANPESAPETPLAPPAAGAERDAAPARPRPSVGLGAFVEVGPTFEVVPGWAAAVAGGGLFRLGPGLLGRLGGFRVFEGEAELGAGRARYDLWGGRADLCLAPRPRRIEVEICGGTALGRLTLEGRGFQANRSVPSVFLAGVARGSAAVTMGPLQLGSAVDLFVPLVRRRAEVVGTAGQVLADRRLSPLGLGLSLTVSWVP